MGRDYIRLAIGPCSLLGRLSRFPSTQRLCRCRDRLGRAGGFRKPTWPHTASRKFPASGLCGPGTGKQVIDLAPLDDTKEGAIYPGEFYDPGRILRTACAQAENDRSSPKEAGSLHPRGHFSQNMSRSQLLACRSRGKKKRLFVSSCVADVHIAVSGNVRGPVFGAATET